MTTLPFDLQGRTRRAAVLAAAEELELVVRHTSDTAFEVDVRDGAEAYRFGQRTTELLEAITRRNP